MTQPLDAGFTTLLLQGVALELATAGAGVYHEDPTMPYADDDIAIVLGLIPQAPDALISLSTYAVSDDFSLGDSVTGLQVRTRAPGESPLIVGAIADSVFSALQGLWSHMLPTGVVIETCQRTSGAPLGVDESGRYEQSDNYNLGVYRPSTHRE